MIIKNIPTQRAEYIHRRGLAAASLRNERLVHRMAIRQLEAILPHAQAAHAQTDVDNIRAAIIEREERIRELG